MEMNKCEGKSIKLSKDFPFSLVCSGETFCCWVWRLIKSEIIVKTNKKIPQFSGAHSLNNFIMTGPQPQCPCLDLNLAQDPSTPVPVPQPLIYHIRTELRTSKFLSQTIIEDVVLDRVVGCVLLPLWITWIRHWFVQGPRTDPGRHLEIVLSSCCWFVMEQDHDNSNSTPLCTVHSFHNFLPWFDPNYPWYI